MDFVNPTPYQAGWTLGFDRDAKEVIVVAVKATFELRSTEDSPALCVEQVPLVEADQFLGLPGMSAPLYESDYAHFKPRCDVLLNATAYAENGRPVRRLNVAVKLGSMRKAFRVTGPRKWEDRLIGIFPSTPEPFTSMPLSYEVAYGGVDLNPDDPARIRTYLENPVGRGFRPHKLGINGQAMPVTEELDQPIDSVTGRYKPMAFGSIGRNWQPRQALAGTYDQHWLDNVAPFWPDDFDFAYFQAAPSDQQIVYPAGGEELVLRNLTPGGSLKLSIPRIDMPVLFIPYVGRDQQVAAVIDTVLVEPDHARLCITWRARLRPLNDCFDIKRVVVGRSSRQWADAMGRKGKKHYAGLSALVRERRGRP